MAESGSRVYSIRTFGHFAITGRGGIDLTPRSRKTRALLAYCIAIAPDRASRERLAALLWGDRGDDQARASLRQALYELRDLTGGEAPLLWTNREQVGVEPARMVTDFQSLETAAGTDDAVEAARLIGDRPADFLVDLNGLSVEVDEWLAAERAHRREERRRVALEIAERALAKGDFASGRRLGLALLAADPLDESAAVIAMDAVGALGDRDEGHRTFARLEQALQVELGVAPSDEVIVTHARLLNGGSAGPAAAPPSASLASAAPAPAPAPTKAPRRAAIWGLAAIIAAAVVATAAWTLLEKSAAPHPTVAVLPFSSPEGDRESRELAKDSAASIADVLSVMGRSVAAPWIAARLQGPDAPAQARRLRVPYIVRGAVRRDRGTVRIAVRLDDINYGVTLLSQSFESPVAEAGGLPDQVAATAGAAIATTDLLTRIDPKGASDPRIATRFLRQMVANHQGDSMLAYDEARKLMAEYPKSPLSQMALAMATAFFISEIAPADRPAAVAKARAAARQVRLDAPSFGDAYVPECLLSPPLWRKACEQRLRYAVSVDAHAPSVDGFLSTLLVEAGRTRESAQLARSAFEVRPFNPHRAAWYLYIVETLGDETEVAWTTRQTDRYWPDRPQIAESAFLGRIARGGWGDARDLLRQRPAGFIFLQPEQLRGLEAMTANLAGRRPDLSAVRAFCTTREPPPLAIAGACLAGLAQLGDLDRAFALADDYYPDLRGRAPREDMAKWLRYGSPPYETSMLFAPVTRALRADPRFIALADRLRLRDYWRSNGWPDFCKAEPAPVCRR